MRRYFYGKANISGCLAAAVALAAASTAMAANATWTGMGTTSNWSDTGNWTGAIPWANGGTAEFLAPAAGQSSYQNITNYNISGNFGAILVDSGAPAITIGGGYMQFATTNLTDFITNNSTNTLTITNESRVFQSEQSVDAKSGIIVLGNLAFRNDFKPVGYDGFQVAVQTTGSENVAITGQIYNQNGTGYVNGLILNNPGAYNDITGTTNNWAGGVDIRHGVLMVSNGATGSATGTGTVTVNGSGIVGNGSISGLVSQNVSGVFYTAGGTLSNGYSTYSNTVGTLAMKGGLNMSGKTATFNFDVASPSSYGNITVGSMFTLSSGDTVNLLGTPGMGTYHLIDYSSLVNATDLSTWTVTGAPAGDLAVLSNNAANSSIDLTISAAVPEPATLGVFALGAMGLLLIGRKRWAQN